MNGLLIQWQYVNAAGDNNVLVTFPVAFDNTCVMAIPIQDNNTGTGSGWGYATSLTNVDCRIAIGSKACRVLSIGY